MSDSRYSVIFSSKTGNTAQLAEAIRGALPESLCDYFGDTSIENPSSEMFYIGFWTNQGKADDATLRFLKTLHDKKIFLFGTAGFGGSDDYFQAILGRTKESIDNSNTVIGTFMCQGKMPQSVRDRYIKMKEQPNRMPNIDQMIGNFDKALSHPDENDLKALKKAVTE